MGAAASKKERFCPPNLCDTASNSGAVVRGPVATMLRPCGSAVTSSQQNSTRGCPLSLSVIYAENPSRSTASAPPAGTRQASAASMTSEPSRRISSLSRPTAFSTLFARSELEHTSSAKPSLRCAGVKLLGLISTSRTGTPRRTSCQAASQPASPAPTTNTRCVIPLIPRPAFPPAAACRTGPAPPLWRWGSSRWSTPASSCRSAPAAAARCRTARSAAWRAHTR